MINEEKVLIERLRFALNSEFIRRNLIKYFMEKGFAETFRRTVYPPMLQDITTKLPELASKVEVTPFIKETHPATGQTTIGWHLYVFGTQRMELGDTTHANMADLMRSSYGPTPQSISTNSKTPQEIIDFIVKIIRNDKMGIVKSAPQSPLPEPPRNVNRPKMGPSQSSSYYEKRKNY
jgi:hypothetical protein